MKKFISLFLSLILFGLTFTAVSASEEGYEAVNTFDVLLNGDFEQGLTSWTYEGTTGSAEVSQSSVYSGQSSLCITTTKASYVTQKVPVAVGDNLIFRVYSDTESYSTNTAYTTITVETWGNGVKTDSKVSNKRVAANNGWMEFTAELNVPEGSEYVLIKLGISAGGTIYFDKAMLMNIPEVIAYDKVELSPLDPNENLIINPSFEIFDGTNVANWNVHLANRYGNWGTNKYTNYATDIVRTGTYSVRIQGLDGRYPDITQDLTGIEPFAQYKFNAYVYSAKSVTCNVFLQYLDANGTVIKSQANMVAGESSRPLNKWYQLTEYMTVSDVENAVSYRLYIRTNSNCDIYIDDLSLQKVGETKPCSIETDQWYYYKEWDGGTADITVSDKILNENPNGSAKVYITRKNNDAVLVEKSYETLAKNLDLSFTTAELNPAYGDVFYVNAEFYDAEGQFIDSHREYFCYYSRPENLLEDGTWLDNDGNPFNVIIANSGSNEEKIKYAASSGITVVTLGYTRNIEAILTQLDLCEKYGVKALIHLHSNSNACGRYPLQTMAVVEAVKDHPATFGYSVQDEPKVVTNPMPGLRISYQLIRDIDRKHPVYFIESCIMQSDDQFKVCDFLCSDAYSAHRASYAQYVAPYMIKLKEGSKKNHNKPTEGLIQTFDWMDYFPTVDEARHMIYQVMFAGVDLAGYYHLDDIVAHEDFADGLVNFNVEELPKVYDLFHTDKCEIISFDNASASEVWYYAWKNGKNTYVTAINRNPNAEKQISFSGLSLPEGDFKTYGNTEGSSIEFNGNNVTLTMAAGSCIMYEYENETTLKIKSGNEYLPLSPRADETVTAIYSPKEGEDEGKEPIVVLAYYDETKDASRLFKVSIHKVQKENGVYTATDTVSKDDVPQKYSVKAFVMENGSIKPMISAEKIFGYA